MSDPQQEIERLRALCAEAYRLLGAAGRGGPPDDPALRRLLDRLDAAAAGVPDRPTHRHYKGGLYQVLFVARHSETEEPLTIYRDCKGGGLWARPTAMFDGHTGDGRRRFVPLPPEAPAR